MQKLSFRNESILLFKLERFVRALAIVCSVVPGKNSRYPGKSLDPNGVGKVSPE
jgi:hypothetical protein